MQSRKYKWHKIAESAVAIILSDNNIAVYEAGGKKFCIGKFRDHFYGFAFKCPHAGGRLEDGYIDAIGNVVCPVHRYKFNLANGRNSSGEGYYLKTYPIEIREDGVYVGIEPGIFSF